MNIFSRHNFIKHISIIKLYKLAGSDLTFSQSSKRRAAAALAICLTTLHELLIRDGLVDVGQLCRQHSDADSVDLHRWTFTKYLEVYNEFYQTQVSTSLTDISFWWRPSELNPRRRIPTRLSSPSSCPVQSASSSVLSWRWSSTSFTHWRSVEFSLLR